MPRLPLALLLLALLLAAPACGDDDLALGIRGSGDLVQRTIDVADLHQLTIGAGFDVTVSRGPSSAVIEVDDNLLDRVRVANGPGSLALTLESGNPIDNATLHATVSMLEISQLVVSGAARVEFHDPLGTTGDLRIEAAGAARISGDFTAAAIALRAGGASQIDATLTAPRIEARAFGASRLTLAGTAEQLELELNGASDAGLRDLEARIASVDLGGASDAEITVSERITRAIVTGASHLTYAGPSPDHTVPIDSQTSTAASSIERR